MQGNIADLAVDLAAAEHDGWLALCLTKLHSQARPSYLVHDDRLLTNVGVRW